MAVMQVQASFPYFTNLPRDVMTNTIHVVTAEPSGFTKQQVATAMATRLQTFYVNAYGPTGVAGDHVLWGSGTIRVYDLSEAAPRVPGTAALNCAAIAEVPSIIPTECAIVMSYHAAFVSGTPRARLRNRIYLGGLAGSAIQAGSTSTFPRITTTLINAIAGAAQALHALNDSDIQWVQYSPTTGVPSPIDAGWIDNTPDTQRRRGVAATSRTTFNV